MTLLAVAVGGAVGAVCRFWFGGWVQGAAGNALPWGTLSVNVLGSLALGFTMVWLHGNMHSEALRHFLVIGLFGSFTTFSTFSYEAVTLLREGHFWRAGGYTAGSVLLGVAAVLVGAAIASGITQTRG